MNLDQNRIVAFGIVCFVLFTLVIALSATTGCSQTGLKRGQQALGILRVARHSIEAGCAIKAVPVCNTWVMWLRSKVDKALLHATFLLSNAPQDEKRWIELLQPAVCDLMAEKWPAYVQQLVDFIKFFEEFVCQKK